MCFWNVLQLFLYVLLFSGSLTEYTVNILYYGFLCSETLDNLAEICEKSFINIERAHGIDVGGRGKQIIFYVLIIIEYFFLLNLFDG